MTSLTVGRRTRVCSCGVVISHPVLSVNKGAHELCRHDAFRFTKWGVIPNDTLGDKVVKLWGEESVIASLSLKHAPHTARRYFDSPTRSRYLRQNGNVPNSLLIVLSKDLADVSLHTDRRSSDESGSPRRLDKTDLRGTWGASTTLA